MGFNKIESDSNRLYFAVNNFFPQSVLVTRAEIKTDFGTNRFFQDKMKRIKSGHWEQFSEAEKGLEQQKDGLKIQNVIILRGVNPFIPNKLRNLVMAKAH